MNSQQFQQLLKKDQYQIFFFTCPANIPVQFAAHPWVVLNNKGIISRWEIFHRTNVCKTSWGHLHLNSKPPTEGKYVFIPFSKV